MLDYSPLLGINIMHVISRKKLKDFWKKRPDTKGPLEAWYAEAKSANWSKPLDIKVYYASASILKNNRVVFNIAGNRYRLVVQINYQSEVVYIKFIGTHAEYDAINAEEI